MSKQDLIDNMARLQTKMVGEINVSKVEAIKDEYCLTFCKLAICNLNVKGTADLAKLDKATLIMTIDSMATLMYTSSWDFDPSVVVKQTQTEADDAILIEEEEKANTKD